MVVDEGSVRRRARVGAGQQLTEWCFGAEPIRRRDGPAEERLCASVRGSGQRNS